MRQILPCVSRSGVEFSARAALRSARTRLSSGYPGLALRLLTRGYNEPMSGSEHVKPANPGLKLTYDDFVLFPDDGKRHELIDGEHYVTPSPNIRHQLISGDLFGLIWNYLQDHPIGRVFYAPSDVVFSEHDVVVPDLLYLSNERAAQVLTVTNVKGAPDLVIEIASPSTRQRDETIKRHLYERSGVAEYWIIDPDINVVRVYKRTGDGGFRRPIELSREAGDVLTTDLLPGLSLPLARIFRE
jgi:Uma2 family endonuclease